MANPRIIGGTGGGIAFKGASYFLDSLKGWLVSYGSADRDISTDRRTLEKRSRSLYQNSLFSRAIISSFTTNVVGNGLSVRPDVYAEGLGMSEEEAKAWNRSTQIKFQMWADSKFCDTERKNTFVQQQDLALKTQLISGDCFVLRNWISSPSPWGMCLKLLEGDRCINPFGVADTNKLTCGVETDDLGAPVAYYFSTVPPYNVENYSEIVPTERVAAFSDSGMPNVFHVFVSERPDQRRGISVLAPIIPALKQQEKYQDAELIAAVVSSMFTVFIKSSGSESAPDMEGNVPDPLKIEPAGPSSAIEMSPAGIVGLGENESIDIADPKRPNANYDAFVNSIFKEAAASLGLSSEVVLRKFETSYNAVRAAILESKKTFDRMRSNLVSDFCRPIYEAWLNESILMGLVKCPGYEDPMIRLFWNKAQWIGDAPMMLDPLKETQAFKMQIDEQLKDRGSVARQMGNDDYDTIASNLAAEKALRTKLGLPEPGGVSKTESVSVQANDENLSENS
jgi:lambda family phage portal protein